MGMFFTLLLFSAIAGGTGFIFGKIIRDDEAKKSDRQAWDRAYAAEAEARKANARADALQVLVTDQEDCIEAAIKTLNGETHAVRSREA